MRAAQSKGKADLLAVWPGRPHGAAPVWFVQCKTGSARVTPAEREELIRVAHVTNGLAVLAQPRKGKRGIELLDIETMKEIEL